MVSIAYKNGQETREHTFENRSAIDVGEAQRLQQLRNEKCAERQRKMRNE